ncbi:MAG: glycosyl transferase family 2 [Candidatus Rokuibacteriota bacterium]|nr:MAG: glycosyl transferase family 2 [Candidatus Rokubacteria bacterium]
MSINVTARSIGESQTPGMKLSAVIPCRNAADRLPRQLEALTREKWQGGWEVVIADNGSTDGTREVAEGFRDRLPHLLVVDASARRGASYARNVGARLASGDAFLFLDADDEIAPGYLPAMADALGHHDFVAAHRDSESLNPKWIRSSRHTHPYEGFRNFYDFLPHAGGTRIGVRRPIFESAGGFDENLLGGEDVDFCWRVQLAGIPLNLVPEGTVRVQYPESLRRIYRQARLSGRTDSLLYRRYRGAGMPGRSIGVGLRDWLRLMRRFPCVRTMSDLARWVRRLGQCVGRLEGSLRYRVIYL